MITAHSSDWHLISRPLYPGQCRHCAAPVLIAIEGGATICADPAPIDAPAEIEEILSGRGTYEIDSTPGTRKAYLQYRDHMRIQAGKGRPVVRSHRCPDGTYRTTSWKPPPDKKPSGPKPRPETATDKTPVPF